MATAKIRQRKREMIDLIVQLHGQQIRDVFIAQYLGVSRVHVRRILIEQGLQEHWSLAQDVFESLPIRLQEACTRFRNVTKRTK